VNRDQPFLLPPCLRDWLPPDHPVHLVIRVIEEHLDTGAFHAGRRTGGPGTAGYDPDMLVALLVWAYANRVTSSRRIEELCRRDVAFMLICGLEAPDHATIARFRAGFADAVAELFAQVLALCARLDMGQLGTIALDGTKVSASASASANKTGDTLRKLAAELVARHGETDAAEDEVLGPGRRGDQVPPQAWSPRRRDERIAAALAGLEAERQAAQDDRDAQARAYLEAAAAGTPPTGPRPAGADLAAAQLRLAQATAAQQARIEDFERRNAAKIAATGTGLPERPPAPVSQRATVRRAAARLGRARARAARRDRAEAEQAGTRKGPGPVRNITDPDSRLMPVRGGGFIQGYNAQNMVSEDGLIIATRLTADTGDITWFGPMLAAAGHAAALITAHRAAAGHHAGSASTARQPGYRPAIPDGQDGYAGPIGLVLADAGYCSEANITTPGPPRLIATGKHRHLEQAARGQQAGRKRTQPATTAMTARLTTPAGITAYRRRSHIAETPHGHIKHNMAFRQLTMRGHAKASAEWQLACAVHNLFKAITTGHLTSRALTALAS
jgi:transposase